MKVIRVIAYRTCIYMSKGSSFQQSKEKKEKMAANWRDNKLQHWDYIIILLKEKHVCVEGGTGAVKGYGKH